MGCSSDSPAGGTPTPVAPGTPVVTATPSAPPPSPTPAPQPTATQPPPTATSVPPTEPAPTATTAPAGPAQVLSRGPTSSRTVALTFDAGADRGFAEQVLDTLRSNGVVADFGLTGQWMEQNPDLVARIAAEGYLVINHTYRHLSFTGVSTSSAPLTQAQRWSELDRVEALMQSLTGKSTRGFFRPPYGDYDASVNRDVGARGYGVNVMWTVDSRGWMGIPAAEIVQRCLQLAAPGAVYVFHVGAQSADAAALPAIIQGLRAMNYSFVSVADYAALQ